MEPEAYHPKPLRTLAASFVLALAALAVVEGALRLAGFRRENAPMTLRFGYPNPREIVSVFRPDAELFWRMRPGSIFDAEAPVPINALGYRGPVPDAVRSAGRIRVAVLGDSVAFGASTAWPELLAARLDAEVLNFGVPGYTVVQGERQYGIDVAALRPDVVVLAYGWNDHWASHGGVRDSLRRVPSGTVASIGTALGTLRIAQALGAVVRRLAPSPKPDPSAPRVPVDEFRARLAAVAGAARRDGAAVIVLGLPSGFDAEAFPTYLLDLGFTSSARQATRDHALYRQASREAAAEAGADFLDLEPLFRDPGGAPRGAWFARDGIHPTAAGHEAIAAAVEPLVRKAGR